MLISSCSSENTRVYGNENAKLYLMRDGMYREYTTTGYLTLFNRPESSPFISRFIECIFMTNYTIGSIGTAYPPTTKTGWFITNINNPS